MTDVDLETLDPKDCPECVRLRALLLTPQEAAAILTAGAYNTDSVSGWKKIRTMRDAK